MTRDSDDGNGAPEKLHRSDSKQLLATALFLTHNINVTALNLDTICSAI